MLNIEELKKEIEKLGYIATEELLYDTFNALCMFEETEINSGQDIYALCLEGPPGAGKTEFAKVYTKLASYMMKEKVALVSYQCDATTGKTELFEDINISAAIRGDADNVNIPGKLIEAIKKVNEGKKVILFIDEYDKAREETDAFLLQFLQSGQINSTQHGDLAIKDEYKSNLQVILCKNDMREELSGPLSRRIRIIRLDYMEPTTFYNVAHRELIEQKKKPVNDGLLNLVLLIYQHIYSKKEVFNRLPSCSEMLIAIEDANRLLTKANAPKHIIYRTIIKNMFKSYDDIKTFESGLNNVSGEKDVKLAELIKTMTSETTDEEKVNINELIANKVFSGLHANLDKKIEEMEALITEYQQKFMEMENMRKAAIEAEVQKILLQSGKLVTTTKPNTISVFEDESELIKRGFNIFDLNDGEWTIIGSASYSFLSNHLLMEKMCEHASSLDIKIYENGILLKEDNDLKLIMVSDIDDKSKIRYRFMSSTPVIPSTYLAEIQKFFNLAKQVYDMQAKSSEQINNEVMGVTLGTYEIDALVYNDTALPYEMVGGNLYNVILSSSVASDTLNNFNNEASCSNLDNVIMSSNTIIASKKKVLKHE